MEARLVGRVPWLVQSMQWTHRLAALSLSKASLAPARSAMMFRDVQWCKSVYPLHEPYRSI